MTDVVALGELLIDFACKSTDEEGYPTLAAMPGGAPSNFLAALCAYGGKGEMIAKVGNDAFGKLLKETLKKRGIGTEGIVTDDSVFTTLAFVTLDESGDREFSFARKPGADTCIKEDEVPYGLIDDCKVFHLGTLSLTDEPARTATKKAVYYAKQKGKLISLDPNLRKPLWNSEAEAKEQIKWALHNADIVKISDEEIDFLWSISPEEGAEKLIKEYGVGLVYATLGANGCYYANKNGSGYVKTPEGIKPADTTGAGDIFGGSAMSMFVKLKKAPDELTADEMHCIAHFACTAASISTLSYGGISSVPDEEKVKELL